VSGIVEAKLEMAVGCVAALSPAFGGCQDGF